MKETQVMDFRRPVRCVVLDPDYAKSSSRRVVSGGMAGNLVLSEKGSRNLQHELRAGWFGSSETTLHSGEGPIYAISWRGPYIAWANDAVLTISGNTCSLFVGSEDMAFTIPSTDYIYRAFCGRPESRSI